MIPQKGNENISIKSQVSWILVSQLGVMAIKLRNRENIFYAWTIASIELTFACFWILEKVYNIRRPSMQLTLLYLLTCYFICRKKIWAHIIYSVISCGVIFMGGVAGYILCTGENMKLPAGCYAIYIMIGLVNLIFLVGSLSRIIRSCLRETSSSHHEKHFFQKKRK